MRKLFLLSPARMDGVRAAMLINSRASFDLAVRLRGPGITLGEAFAFASGLYFRGKLAYAERFAEESEGAVRVITTNAGLLDPRGRVGPADLRRFGEASIDPADPRFHGPLRRHAAAWARKLGKEGMAVLLGSIATDKYRAVLLEALGDRLYFPPAFVGRGDMSRGALLLRAARSGEELAYVPVAGACYTGRRASRVTKGARSAKPSP